MAASILPCELNILELNMFAIGEYGSVRLGHNVSLVIHLDAQGDWCFVLKNAIIEITGLEVTSAQTCFLGKVEGKRDLVALACEFNDAQRVTVWREANQLHLVTQGGQSLTFIPQMI